MTSNYGTEHNHSALALARVLADPEPPGDLNTSLQARDIILDQLQYRLGHTLQLHWAPPEHQGHPLGELDFQHPGAPARLLRALRDHPRGGPGRAPTDLFSDHPDQPLVRAARSALLATDHLTAHPRALPSEARWQVTADVADTTMAVATLDRSLATHPDLDPDARKSLTTAAGPLYLTAQVTQSTARAGDLDPRVDQAQRQGRPIPLLVTDPASAAEAIRNLDRLLRAYPAINDTDLRDVMLGQSRINHDLGQHAQRAGAVGYAGVRDAYQHRRDLLRRTASEMRHVASLPSMPTGHPAVAQTVEIARYLRGNIPSEMPRQLSAAVAQNVASTGQALTAGLRNRHLLVRDRGTTDASWRPLSPGQEEPAISTCARALQNHRAKNRYTLRDSSPPVVPQHGRTALADQLNHSQPPLVRPRAPGAGRDQGYERS